MKSARIVPITRLPRNLALFDYSIPDDMRDACLPGTFVTIPFRKKTIAGLVWSVDEARAETLKPITRTLPLRYMAWNMQRAHFEWFARHYCISRATALKALLPDFPRSYLSTGVLRKQRTLPSVLHESFLGERYRDHCALIKKTLKKKKNILICVPTIHEAALLEPHARAAAGDAVTVMHSDLSAGLLFSRWSSLFDRTPHCIIATRAGACVPLHNLGALIVDSAERNEHNQYDLNPRFDVRAVALDIHTRTGCPLVYASDTPRLEEFFLSKRKPCECTATIINMRDEIRATGRGYISEQLIDSVRESLAQKRGAFLFVNRTGASRMITCRDCGHVFSCAQCDAPARAAQSRLICTQCNADEILPSRCPACQSVRFHFIALGTEKIAELVKKEFPDSRVLEFTQQKHPQDILKRLHRGTGVPELHNAIIVGTSYLLRACPEAFRSIGCIGVLSGDPTLTLSDFRSEERHVQLLFEFMRLAKLCNAKFLVQTFSPDARYMKALHSGNYDDYARGALTERAAHQWPPSTRLFRLRLQRSDLPPYPGRHIVSLSPHALISGDPISSIVIADRCVTLGATIRSKTDSMIVFSIPQKTILNAELPEELQSYLRSLPYGWLVDIDPVIL